MRGRTLAAAAEKLGVNYTTVARRIARAEEHFGEALFERLADGYVPTEAGNLVARHAADMETAEHAMLRGLQGRERHLSGELTLTAPQLLVVHFLAPALDTFASLYPSVSLRLRATNELLDLNRREADFAIRISRNPGDSLTGIRLTEQHNAAFASPHWVERALASPDAPANWLVYEQYEKLPGIVLQRYPGSRVHMRFDDMVAMAGAAAAGLGAVRMPMFLGRSLGGLVQVPNLPPQPYADIWLVAHPDVWPGSKLEVFREIVVPYFRARRPLFLA